MFMVPGSGVEDLVHVQGDWCCSCSDHTLMIHHELLMVLATLLTG